MTGSMTVVGAGGHAKVVIATLRAAGVAVEAVYDDRPELAGGDVAGVPVRGPVAAMVAAAVPRAVLAVGDNRARQRIAERLARELPGCGFPPVVHPAAVVDPTVRLGAGTVIFAGAVVQTDASLGRHGIVNTGASVDHDCLCGDFFHLAPGAHLAGGVEIGEGAFLGIGSCVIPGRRVGDWTVVGAGAAVVTDLPPAVTAAGVPARILGRPDASRGDGGGEAER